MFSRRILPLAILLGLTAGCSGRASAQTAGPQASTPAPFAAPPVLSGTPDVATLVAKVKPAVVNITTVHSVKAAAHEGFSLPFGFDPRAHRDAPDGEQEDGATYKEQALGSGFLIDAAGHVVTNAHVIDGADTVRVKLADDREFDAKVKGRDAKLDVAVLELQGAKDLPVSALGDSGGLRVGEYVVAIGNPFGLGDTVTMGIVSAKGRELGASPYDDFIQTDASINPGNSGGPLFNLRGQVVGINAAINPNGQGIGFAIPIDAVKEILPQLLSTGHVERGRLGVIVQPVDASMAKALGLGTPHGALVSELEKNGPAQKAGVKDGDVIVSVDGAVIQREQDLPRIVARHAPSTHAIVGVLRDGREMKLDATLAALVETPAASEEATATATPAATPTSGLGVQVADAPGGGARVEHVLRGAPAEGALEAGDVVLEIDHSRVASAHDLVSRVGASAKGHTMLMKIRRGERTMFVAVEPKKA